MTTTTFAAPIPAREALDALWHDAGLDDATRDDVALPGAEPVLPSSFAVATALQASLGAATRAAARIGALRGGPVQTVSVDALDVVRESAARFSVDGRTPEMWDPVSGLYACGTPAAPGWVRVHANFAHHRDVVLRLLKLPTGPGTPREAVAQALQGWEARAFEQAVADAGGVVAALRTADAWAAHPHQAAVAAQPLVALQRTGDAPLQPPGPLLAPGQRPLQGLRVLDLTRILAGPVAGRTLASFGAEVMLVNSPGLPNIESIADTSRGKLSVHVDLKTTAGRDTLRALVREADVFLQGYRPGALAALGFGPEALAALRPGLVCVSLSAYGDRGPWGGRRGFDSLVQAATGFNHDEGRAFGSTEPRALPLQALDYGAGYLLAFGAQAALLRRAQQGGSWQVQVSLARTGQWLRSLGRCTGFHGVPKPAFDEVMETVDSGFGRLQAVRPAARFSHTPAGYARPSMPPGSHPPVWPPR